jgi:hypothetical protein
LVPVVERHYRVLDTIFAIRCTDSATADSIDEALGPARTDERRIDEIVTVAPEGGAFSLYVGEDVHHDLARESLVPTVKAGVIYTALARDARCGVVHAAAAAEDDRIVLLPGLSGSGKSTLTAGLVGMGMNFIADDTVVLDDSGGIRPINSALCVKDGSWPHLARAYPELAKATIFVRSDGKRVRYMAPRFAPQVDHARYSVASIIFPRYDPRGPTRLLPLEKGEALEKLLPLMFSESGDLESSHLDRAVELVGSARYFVLELCSLEEGGAAVRAAVRGAL